MKIGLPRKKSVKNFLWVIFLCVFVWDGIAYAFVSSDFPILTEILAVEIKNAAHLGGILAQASATVKEIKEVTTLGKTVYGAIDELRHLSKEELKKAALLGVQKAFPEVGEMYKNINDIKDMDYRNYRSEMTLRGILWEKIYGPAIETFQGQEDLQAMSEKKELAGRIYSKEITQREQLRIYEKDCEKGHGACLAASQRASIQQALTLIDLSEITISVLDTVQRQQQDTIKKDVQAHQSYERWIHDLKNHADYVLSHAKNKNEGDRLYQRYGEKVEEYISQYRSDNHY